MISDKFVILGALVTIYGDIAYARDTLQGKTKPNRVTWVLWALAPLVAFAAELNKGIGLIALMTFAVGFGPLIVLLASFINKKSYWELRAGDYLCGILSLLGLVLWVIYHDSNIAIIFSVLGDLSAAAPTLAKSFKHPETESVVAYWTAGLSAIVTILAIDHWTIANYAFPIYILLVNIAFVSLIKYRVGQRFS